MKTKKRYAQIYKALIAASITITAMTPIVAFADINTIIITSAEQFRTIVGFANDDCENNSYILKLFADLEFSDTALDQGNGLAAIPNINPSCAAITIEIDGQGNRISRSALSSNEFRFVSVGSAGNLSLKNVTLSGFGLSDFDGGTLHTDIGALLKLDNVTIENSRLNASGTKTLHGGAILNRGELIISHSTIKDSVATHGGGIANLLGQMTITSSDIRGNEAVLGGGIYTKQTGNFEAITKTIVSDNIAVQGGAIYSNSSGILILESTIESNKGGGVYSKYDPSLDINFEYFSDVIATNSTFSGNTSASNASAIQAINANVTLTHTTITDNTGTSAIDLTRSNPNRSDRIRLNESLLAGNVSIDDSAVEFNCQTADASVIVDIRRGLIGDSRHSHLYGMASECQTRINPGVIVGFSDADLPQFGNTPTQIDDILFPLNDNGCAEKSGAINQARCVKTHALKEQSPALNPTLALSTIASPPFDQRGEPRSIDPNTAQTVPDYGSYEGFIVEIIEQESCYVVPTKNHKVINFCL